MPVSLVNLETSFSQTTPIWSILCNITGLSLECTTKSPKRVNFINYMIRNELVLPQFDRPTDLVLMRFGRNYACTACMEMKLFNKTDVKNLNK